MAEQIRHKAGPICDRGWVSVVAGADPYPSARLLASVPDELVSMSPRALKEIIASLSRRRYRCRNNALLKNDYFANIEYGRERRLNKGNFVRSKLDTAKRSDT